jgi:hypothetical protein
MLRDPGTQNAVTTYGVSFLNDDCDVLASSWDEVTRPSWPYD